MQMRRFVTVGLLLFAFVFAQGVIGQTARGPLRPEGMTLSDADGPQPIRVMEGEKGLPQFQIAPPASFAERPRAATFTIQYLNAGEVNYYGDVCIGWPEEAKAAFTYSANIWGTLLNSAVPIKISACWANMGTGGILGHGGARSYYKDFTGAPQANTWYPVAIANALYGSDLNGGTEEMVIAYNAQFTSWFFGTGTCPADKIDFAQVIMHEMCHGLGFIGSMSVSSGLGYWGLSDNVPVIYDRYTENGAGTKLIAYTSGTADLYNQLVSGGIYFNGPNANAGNGGARVPLYSPNPWKSGSSYAHLDQIYNGTPNAMMTYSVSYGETIHDPGPVTMGILKDNGWNAAPPQPVTPTIQANGASGTVVVNYPQTVTVAAALNAGTYAGSNVDWWLVIFAHAGQWAYIDSALQLQLFDGNLANCRPINQGPLFNLPLTAVLNNYPLPVGTYDFWFAVSYPMTGILNPSGLVLFDKVTVVVQ